MGQNASNVTLDIFSHDVEAAFQLLGVEDSLTYEELEKYLTTVGPPLSPADVNELCLYLDKDHSGTIEVHEIAKWWKLVQTQTTQDSTGGPMHTSWQVETLRDKLNETQYKLEVSNQQIEMLKQLLRHHEKVSGASKSQVKGFGKAEDDVGAPPPELDDPDDSDSDDEEDLDPDADVIDWSIVRSKKCDEWRQKLSSFRKEKLIDFFLYITEENASLSSKPGRRIYKAVQRELEWKRDGPPTSNYTPFISPRKKSKARPDETLQLTQADDAVMSQTSVYGGIGAEGSLTMHAEKVVGGGSPRKHGREPRSRIMHKERNLDSWIETEYAKAMNGEGSVGKKKEGRLPLAIRKVKMSNRLARSTDNNDDDIPEEDFPTPQPPTGAPPATSRSPRPR